MSGPLPGTFVAGFHDQKDLQKLTYRKLGSTDMMVSSLSFGASSLGGVFKTTDDNESLEIVEMVVKSGINYIDTAPWYGQGRSEEVLGRALKNIPRDAYYIATKVGRYELDPANMFNFSKEKIVRSVRESLSRLQLDYVDVIQVHNVEYVGSLHQIVEHTIPALLQLKKEGLFRYIGITGYSLDVLMRLIDLLPPGSVDTVLTYCRATLVDQTLLGEPLKFFKDKGVGVINASPVGMGLLSHRGPPPSWHPATPTIKSACLKAAQICSERGFDITELSVLWTLEQDFPTSLISSRSRENIKKNIEWARNGRLGEEQAKMVEDLELNFFRFLPSRHWENIEVSQYWNEMAKLELEQTMDD